MVCRTVGLGLVWLKKGKWGHSRRGTVGGAGKVSVSPGSNPLQGPALWPWAYSLGLSFFICDMGRNNIAYFLGPLPSDGTGWVWNACLVGSTHITPSFCPGASGQPEAEVGG